MRYVKDHGRRTRSRIVEKASHGLLQRGMERLSVAHAMKLAGLTNGGFYSYFASREDLVLEAFTLAMDRTVSRWLGLPAGTPLEQRFVAWVDDYLSPRHRDDRAGGCALPALGTDFARSSKKAQRLFAAKLEEMLDVFACVFAPELPEQARHMAIGALATMMGAVVLARAVGNKALSEDILEAARSTVRVGIGVRRSGSRRRNEPCDQVGAIEGNDRD